MKDLQMMFLNIWEARLLSALTQYILENKEACDVFCFEEVHQHVGGFAEEATPHLHKKQSGNSTEYCTNSYEVLSEILSDQFAGSFSPEICYSLDGLESQVAYGSAMFWRRGLNIIDCGVTFVNEKFNERTEGKPSPRLMQHVVLNVNSTKYLIAHFHGIWVPEGKGDTDGRIEQSTTVLRTLRATKEKYSVQKIILGGDMNLDRGTESLDMLAGGMMFGEKPGRNLIFENKILSTRNSHYRNYNVPEATLYADYVFVSDNVDVKKFTAPETPAVSDHRPLILTCS